MEPNKFIWSLYITDYETMPAPRLPHSKQAQFLNDRAQKYFENRDGLAWIIKAQWKKKQIASPIVLRIEVGITHNRKCDWDNFGKTVSDALVKSGVLLDDKLVEKGEVTVFRGLEHPFTALAIYEGGVKPCLAATNPIRINVSPNAVPGRQKTRT